MSQDEHGKRVLAEHEERIGHRMAEHIERAVTETPQGEPGPVSDVVLGETQEELMQSCPRTYTTGDNAMVDSDSGEVDGPLSGASTNPVGEASRGGIPQVGPSTEPAEGTRGSDKPKAPLSPGQVRVPAIPKPTGQALVPAIPDTDSADGR